jgi:hypothetical protein
MENPHAITDIGVLLATVAWITKPSPVARESKCNNFSGHPYQNYGVTTCLDPKKSISEWTKPPGPFLTLFQHLSIAVSQACEAFSRVVELGQITSIQKSKLF